MSRLPFDILFNVLERATYLSTDNVGNWKTLMSLLSVNSLWRRLALSHISRQAILVYKTNQSTLSRNGWISNIGLISITKRTKNIKTVIIEIDTRTNIILTLKSMQVLFKEYPWINAKSLKLIFECNAAVEPTGFFNNIGDNSESEVNSVAYTLLKHMPNISALCISGNGNNEMCDIFIQNFSTMCANQLNSYSGRISSLTSALQIPLQLSSLTLVFGNHMEELYFPRIDSSILRLLKLIDLPDDNIWKCFGNNSDLSNIWFYNLETLSLNYIASYTERDNFQRILFNNSRACKLHFPRLEKLEVENCPTESILLKADINIATLKDVNIIDITGKIEPGKLISNVSMDTLSITSYSPYAKDEYFRNIANRLFGHNCKAKHTSLTLGYSAGLPNPVEINWSKLHKLTIFAPVSSETLLGLIPKMPNLMELVLGGNVTHDWSAPFETTFATQTEADIIQPISTSLITFYLGDVFLSHASDTTEFLKYVLLKTPSLVEFACSEEHFTGLLEFLKAKYITYPHLQAINYNVLA